MGFWEPWTGCYAASDGCKYCYYYGPYSKRFGQNTIVKTEEFDKPLRSVYMPRKKITKYVIEGGKTVATCFATDFFLPEADDWRGEAWNIMRQRPDLQFLFFTKRIDRFFTSLPDDWGVGYENVTIGCTVENQEMADYRMPLFLSYPIRYRIVGCSPLLSPIDLRPYLWGVESVTVGGESGREARICDYDWVLDLRAQCTEANVGFLFKCTGSRFRMGDEVKPINPRLQHRMAREFHLNTMKDEDMTL